MTSLLRKDKVVTLFVIGTIVLAGVAYTWSVLQKAALERAQNNPAAHSFKTETGQTPFTDMAGNTLSLTDQVGSVLVVNSWASWSPDSAVELPVLEKIAMEFKDRNVKVLAVNRAEPQSTAERFLRVIGATDGVELVLDPDDRYYRSIAGYAMPETVFYDTKGNVVYHHHGTLTYEQVREYVTTALSASENALQD